MWSVFVIYAQSRSLPAEFSSNPDQTQLNQLKEHSQSGLSWTL